jgi:undecaprenyl-diphosphatase
MDILVLLQAALLGIVEGITEFLPVSSTGHLILMGDVLGFNDPGNVFDISIQMGAILAVCAVYWQKLWGVAVSLPKNKESQRFALNVAVAFLPAAAVGAVAHGYIKEHLFNSTVVAISLVLGGIAILLIERKVKVARYASTEAMPVRTAFFIGLVQCLAMVPGVSRSGATIMGALMAGVERKAAAEFSFFLAIPTLSAAAMYDLYKNWEFLDADSLTLIAVGFVVAFLSSLLIVKWMIGFVSRHGFAPFAWYRIVLGGVILLFVA